MRRRQYQKKKKKKKNNNNKQRKRPRQKNSNKKHYRQHGGFLNRYDFAYAGHDTVNQAAKVALGVIKAAANGINTIKTDRINQIITQGGKVMEHVLPKILRGATEDVYQIPFRILGDFRKQ